ncbi:ABC transporter substrate-binding protein [Holophaga foetida]|uniref:ABC transporter substrate-binding protein n=1 Tax=Holophaga foetida TaxID=35839 RepID=UPI0002473ACC|nr:ABC transporter substrate-binding protein [Holophaga foetida]
MREILLPALLSIIASGASFAWGEAGVLQQELRVGMSNALSGPAAQLGSRLKVGVDVYFNKVNTAGGVNGRKIKLISYDDAYEPGKCVAYTAKLLESDNVFALLGYVGTPTSSAVLPLVTESRVPFVAPLTGADSFRSPVKNCVYNVRASYADETEYLVEHLTKDLGIKRIGIMVQNDSFGAAGEEGVLAALRRRSMSLQGKGTFKRNTEDVGAGLAKLQEAQPEAVVLIGTYQSLAAVVKKAKTDHFKPTFATISFVGTESLVQALGADGDGVYISQVMPSPVDARVPLIAAYQKDMKAAGENLDYGSLEGYVNAAVFVEGLKKCGANPTREAFLAAMDALQIDLGGVNVHYTPSNHQALKKVYGVRIQAGKAVPVEVFN